MEDHSSVGPFFVAHEQARREGMRGVTRVRRRPLDKAVAAVTADIRTAPRDGTTIVVLFGPWRLPVSVYWQGGWIKVRDGALLEHVTHWIMVPKKLRGPHKKS